MQQVNLLQVVSTQQKVPLSVSTMMTLMASVLAALVLLSIYDAWQLNAQKQAITQLRQAELTAEKQLIDYSETYPRKTLDEALVAQVEQAEREKNRKLSLLAVLKERRTPDYAGMSGYLSDLQQYNQKGVWLERIWIGRGGASVVLAGHATEASRVPAYLASLSKSGVYGTLGIRKLDLEKNSENPGIVDFILASQGQDWERLKDNGS